MLKKLALLPTLAVMLAGCGPTLSERGASMSCAELEAMCTTAYLTMQQPPPPPVPEPTVVNVNVDRYGSGTVRSSSSSDGFARGAAMYHQSKYRQDLDLARAQLNVCLREIAQRCPAAHARVTSRL